MKTCIFFKIATARTGETKVRCKFDGSLRNWCRDENCPHFRPTLWWRIQNAWDTRQEEKQRRKQQRMKQQRMKQQRMKQLRRGR